MSITLFGVLWIAALIAVLSKSIRNLPYLVILSMCFQCVDCISIGGVGIGPHIITCSIFLALSFRKKIKRIKPSLYMFGGLMLVTIALVSSALNGILNIQIIFKIFQLLVYVLTANILLKNTRISYEQTSNFIDKLVVFLLVMGGVQLVITAGNLPKLWIIRELFYNNTENVAFYNENYFRVSSIFMEPSYYAPFLSAMFFYFYFRIEKNKNYLKMLVFIILELILTFSSTAYGALLICFILYLIYDMFTSNKIKKKNIIFIAVGLTGLLSIGFGTNILDEVIFNKMSTGSGVTRTRWNQEAINSFNNSPLLGEGYKQSRASSIVYCVLGELGLFGLIAYTAMIVGLLKKFSRKNSVYIFMIIPVVVCQVIAIPDVDLSSAWLVIFICCLLFSQDQKQLINKRRTQS